MFRHTLPSNRVLHHFQFPRPSSLYQTVALSEHDHTINTLLQFTLRQQYLWLIV